MVEDAVYNILNDYDRENFMDEVDSLNVYYSNLPKFRELIASRERYIQIKEKQQWL
jgi:hypothetical protein